MGKRDTILVVDDERAIRESFKVVLSDKFNVLCAENGRVALQILRENPIRIALMDIRLPDMDGLDLLLRFKEVDPDIEVIMVTAVKEIQSAVKAIKSGAYEYIIKPFIVDEVMTIIERALEKQTLLREVDYLRNELERCRPFEKMVGAHPKMTRVFNLILKISKTRGTVLVLGESGTGKELVAHAIHNLSPRKEHPFIVINCAAIPGTLLESEIFGHTRGAFTGALNTAIGKIEIANKGTVFFDDIDSLDINMQAKLLRAIQEREFQRLGSSKIIQVDVRYIAACNKDLKRLMSLGQFREDLYYRLNVFPLQLPPLRERKRDIPVLIDHFLRLCSEKTGEPAKIFSKTALEAMEEYDWPGNVRELQNLVERMVTVSQKPVIEMDDLSAFSFLQPEIRDYTLKEAVGNFERQYILNVLEKTNSNRTQAAKKLGIHRNTLISKINGLGIDTERQPDRLWNK